MVGVGVDGGGVAEIVFCGKGVGERIRRLLFGAKAVDGTDFLFAINKYPVTLKDMTLRIVMKIIANLLSDRKSLNFEEELG
jgi:hypothetical protein